MLLRLVVSLTLSAAPSKTRIAVTEIEAGAGVDAKVAHLMTSTVTAALRRNPELSVVSEDDIKNLLGFEHQKQLLNCGTTSCLAEIAGALGAGRVVNGSLSLLGHSYVFIVRVIDTHDAHVVREVQRRLKTSSPDELLDLVPEMVSALTPRSGSAPDAAVSAPEPPRAKTSAPWWIAGAGGVVALVGVAVLLPAALGAKVTANQTAYTYPQAQAANTQGYVGQGLLYGGAAVGVGGLLWGLLQGHAEGDQR